VRGFHVYSKPFAYVTRCALSARSGLMRSPAGKRALSCAAVLFLAWLGTGCSHMPWHHSPPPPPVPVHELDLTGAGSYPQYWKRNTLLLDLTSASGSGTVTLKPVQGTTWPVRIAVRVRPGAFPVLEVRGDQRLNLPISSSGSAPIDLEFTPGVYTSKTVQIVVSWGAAATNAPVPATPAVVTPH
jgi:hypothetical protein